MSAIRSEAKPIACGVATGAFMFGACCAITALVGRILKSNVYWKAGSTVGTAMGVLTGGAVYAFMPRGKNRSDGQAGDTNQTSANRPAENVSLGNEPVLVSEEETWAVKPVLGCNWQVDVELRQRLDGSVQINTTRFTEPERRAFKTIGLVNSSQGPLFLYQPCVPNQVDEGGIIYSFVAYDLRSNSVVKTFDNSYFDPETDYITEGGIVQVRPQQFTVTPFFGEHVYRRSAGFEQQFVAARLLPGGSGHPEEQKVIVWDNAGHFFSFYRHNLQRSMDGSLRLPLDATCSFLELPEMAGRLLLLSLGNSAPGTLRICDTLADGLVGPPIEAFDHPHPITNMKVVQANRDGFTVRISHTRGERILTRAELYQHLPRS